MPPLTSLKYSLTLPVEMTPVEKKRLVKCALVFVMLWSLKLTRTTTTRTVPVRGARSRAALRTTRSGVPTGNSLPGTIRPSLRPGGFRCRRRIMEAMNFSTLAPDGPFLAAFLAAAFLVPFFAPFAAPTDSRSEGGAGRLRPISSRAAAIRCRTSGLGATRQRSSRWWHCWKSPGSSSFAGRDL